MSTGATLSAYAEGNTLLYSNTYQWDEPQLQVFFHQTNNYFVGVNYFLQ